MTLKYSQTFRALKSRGLTYERDLHNKLRVHNKNESHKHFVVRALLFKLLTDEGHQVFSEYPINEKDVDLLDVNTFLVYEVETNPVKDYAIKRFQALNGDNNFINDIILIDLQDAELQTNDFTRLLEVLKKKIGYDRR